MTNVRCSPEGAEEEQAKKNMTNLRTLSRIFMMVRKQRRVLTLTERVVV